MKLEMGSPLITIPNNGKWDKANRKEGGPPNKNKTGEQADTEPKKSELTKKKTKQGEQNIEYPINLRNTIEENENQVSPSKISRKRNATKSDGVLPQNAKIRRTAFVSDLVGSIMKINESEY